MSQSAVSWQGYVLGVVRGAPYLPARAAVSP